MWALRLCHAAWLLSSPDLAPVRHGEGSAFSLFHAKHSYEALPRALERLKQLGGGADDLGEARQLGRRLPGDGARGLCRPLGRVQLPGQQGRPT